MKSYFLRMNITEILDIHRGGAMRIVLECFNIIIPPLDLNHHSLLAMVHISFISKYGCLDQTHMDIIPEMFYVFHIKSRISYE